MALPPTLSRSRSLVEPALRAAVDQLDETTRHIASYHLGWVEADGRPTIAGGGKAVRPALALLSAQAVGAAPDFAVPGAVAVELVHNFSLLHDDLMDRDVQRRHRATVWAVWDASAAILVGDAMLTLAQQVLAQTELDTALAALSLLAAATQDLIRGQVQDLSFERRVSVTVEECVSMAAGKTGALLGCSAAIGAVLAGGSPEVVAALRAYGEEVGLAFQLVDDLLGIWGDPEVTGKPVGSDLRARKKSLPICYAVGAGTSASAELADWLAGEGPDTEEQIARASELVDVAGGRKWARQEAERRVEIAFGVLDTVSLDKSAHAELVALGQFIVTREK